MNASGDRQVILVLQGGGALGAYHIGACKALAEAGYEPDWVTGISIGAINACIVAGNPPAQRLAALEALWQDISRPDGWGEVLSGPALRLFNTGSAMEALLVGQPNFFVPRVPNPLFAPTGTVEATSFYDTSPLRDTLLRHADFARINARTTRLSLGATRVTTGELVFFDNARQPLAPEHVMASGSLPPGFPATAVDGELYWDGGCVSNTPLEAVLHDPPAGDALVFMIDLWNPCGPAPGSIDEVTWRQKQIQYASRTTHHIEVVARQFNLQRRVALAGAAPADPAVPDAPDLVSGRLDIVHVVYQPSAEEVSNSDAEFSRPSIERRSAAGYHDMHAALAQAPWTVKHAAAVGSMVHRFTAGAMSSRVY
ncbi:NTE family protein [Plasticicumulans lactativorans]|uniref:NTE family protein n=1 Tax=Plasticicumulans lactativorans TaxID=1133106 RepID=A0A4R2L197_9GAMM|nr:patatin-like phospholipase family protein [Plasticicumulans lactativorans]TCO76328.1 NTE family protein [Plasticicumulans lactativorans]